MGKQYILLFALFKIAILAHGNDIARQKPDNAGENWFQNLHHAKGKVTHLQLYVQDILSGPNPTNIPVANANSTFTSPTLFGLVSVLDDPVRTGPDPDSEIVGRAQGILAFTSLEEFSLHMTFHLVFTSGKYNGSSLSLVGHNRYLHEARELPIVGGSGAFRLARGVVMVRTVSLNTTTGDAFFQYNITVLHY